MKTTLYYHIYLTDDYGTWSSIFLEQFKLMEDVGLLQSLDRIKINAICKNDDRCMQLVGLARSFSDKCEIVGNINNQRDDTSTFQNINSADTLTENITMRDIYNDCLHEDQNVLYIHAKGVTSVETHLKPGKIQTFKNYYYWRQFLNWGVIENWKEALVRLEDHDIVGVNYFDTPAPHFSGSFFWTKSSYVRQLSDPARKDWWYDLQNNTTSPWLKTAPDRFRDEMWSCSKSGARIFSFCNLGQETNLSATFLPSSVYKKGN